MSKSCESFNFLYWGTTAKLSALENKGDKTYLMKYIIYITNGKLILLVYYLVLTERKRERERERGKTLWAFLELPYRISNRASTSLRTLRVGNSVIVLTPQKCR